MSDKRKPSVLNQWRWVVAWRTHERGRKRQESIVVVLLRRFPSSSFARRRFAHSPPCIIYITVTWLEWAPLLPLLVLIWITTGEFWDFTLDSVKNPYSRLATYKTSLRSQRKLLLYPCDTSRKFPFIKPQLWNSLLSITGEKLSNKNSCIERPPTGLTGKRSPSGEKASLTAHQCGKRRLLYFPSKKPESLSSNSLRANSRDPPREAPSLPWKVRKYPCMKRLNHTSKKIYIPMDACTHLRSG